MNEKHLQYIQNVLDEAVSTNKFAGNSCLVYQGGVIRGFWTSGYADIEAKKPFSRDTICRIFSMTKVVTSIAAWILIERGKIDIASPVSDYLEEFSSLNVCTPEGKIVPAKNALLVRDLLNMTSGYSYGGLQDESHRQIAVLISKIDSALKNGAEMSGEEIAKQAAKIPLSFEPGESFEYGISADILGVLIERVSKMSLSDFFKKEIFEPLGMKDTAFFVSAEKKARVASVYEQYKDEDGKRALRKTTEPILGIANAPEKLPAFQSGGAGLLSTVDDYMKLCRMFAEDGALESHRVLQAGTVRAMHTLHIAPKLQKVFEEKHPSLSGYTYGNLMRQLLDAGQSTTANRGNSEFGWDGALGTYMAVDSGNDLAIVFFTQCKNDGGYTSVARKIKNIVYASLSGKDDISKF